jgi:hypothetical protein
MYIFNYYTFNNRFSPIEKDMKNTCSRDSTSRNDDGDASQKYLSISSENTLENIREISKNTYPLSDEHQQNAQGIDLFIIYVIGR